MEKREGSVPTGEGSIPAGVSEAEQEIKKLKEGLDFERQGNKNIYQIARFAQMLKVRGQEVDLTPSEQREILDSLENARNDEDRKILEPQGYEVARWLALSNVLGLNEQVQVTQEDKQKILEAAEEYKIRKDFNHLASLIKTSETIGLDVGINDLSDKDRQVVEDELKKM